MEQTLVTRGNGTEPSTFDQYGPDGRQYVGALASAWRHHQTEADDARAQLIAKVSALAAAGISEYALADAAGVTRQTIRKWLGK